MRCEWVVVGAFGDSLLNFRGDLLRRLAADVGPGYAASEPAAAFLVKRLAEMGVEHRGFPVARSGLSPLQDVVTCYSLWRVFRDVRATHVLAYTVKPVVWGGVALWFSPRTNFTALITGLGYVFEPVGVKRKVIRAVVVRLYKLALLRADAVVFQNSGNRDDFIAMGIVGPDKCHVVNGSGVDVGRYTVEPFPQAAKPRFLLIARLLGDKGVREFVEAGQLLAGRGVDIDIVLAGPSDPSPDGIPLTEVEGWVTNGDVDYLRGVDDVRPVIADCHVYVLPSYHEGMPRTVLEAMSMGRPVLTTDVPGCRETVVEGENGWLVPKRDVEALADKMQWFAERRDEWGRMGEVSRLMAEERFDVHKVNEDMVRIMGFGSGGDE